MNRNRLRETGTDRWKLPAHSLNRPDDPSRPVAVELIVRRAFWTDTSGEQTAQTCEGKDVQAKPDACQQ